LGKKKVQVYKPWKIYAEVHKVAKSNSCRVW
jgi:hypothetical protein